MPGTPRRPLWEPRLKSAQVLRIQNLSHGDFNKFVRSGKPLIVKDCAAGWPLLHWTCKDFKRTWKPRKHQSKWCWVNRGSQLASKRRLILPKHLSNHTGFFEPLFCRIKALPPASIEQVFRIPYFMEGGATKAKWEHFWMHEPGFGTAAHVDGVLDHSVHVQLGGLKTWRLGPYPDIHTTFDVFESSDAGDGKLYTANLWNYTEEVDVGPGECIVYPPGYAHETYMDPDKNSDCSVSLTVGFKHPRASAYLRAHLPRLMLSHDVFHEVQAVNQFSDLAQFWRNLGSAPKPDVDLAEISARVAETIAAFDSDQDAMLNLEEVCALFKQTGVGSKSKQELDSIGRDLMAYHDSDEDGHISHEELSESTFQFNVLHSRLLQNKGIDPSAEDSTELARSIESSILKTFGGCEEGDGDAGCLRAVKSLEDRVLLPLQKLAAWADEGEDEGEDVVEHEQNRHEL